MLHAQPHAFDFAIIGNAHDIAIHGFHAHGLVADQRIGIHFRALLFQLMRVIAETIEAPPAIFANQVKRRRWALGEARGRKADTAIADHHSCHTLADLAGHAGGAAQHSAVIMRVAVNEARRHGLAARHHFAVCAGAAQIAHRHNAVARDTNITAPACGAGAINDGRIADDQIAAESHGAVLGWDVADRGIMTQRSASGNPISWPRIICGVRRWAQPVPWPFPCRAGFRRCGSRHGVAGPHHRAH